jgi:hypothetical protein
MNKIGLHTDQLQLPQLNVYQDDVKLAQHEAKKKKKIVIVTIIVQFLKREKKKTSLVVGHDAVSEKFG